VPNPKSEARYLRPDVRSGSDLDTTVNTGFERLSSMNTIDSSAKIVCVIF